MFVAPPEVDREILHHSGKTDGELDGYAVVSWCLEQSCQMIERAQALRILQGLNHGHRRATMKKLLENHPDIEAITTENDLAMDAIAAIKEKDEQRLHDLYAPIHMRSENLTDIVKISRGSSDPTIKELLNMWETVSMVPKASSSLEEEHEREISHEKEQQKEVQRPLKVLPLDRTVDPNLEGFVKGGRLIDFQKFNTAYDHVVKSTSIKLLGSNRHPWFHLRVTEDFVNTVQQPPSGFYDNYLRPVNFVLTSIDEINPGTLLIVSPWEVNMLLREIQSPDSHVLLHVYEPRVTRQLRSVDFGINPPPHSMEEWQTLNSGLRRELNLFAGQLYFNTYKDYTKLKKDLGPRLNPSVDQTLAFIRSWIAIRRMGQDFLQTHIGYLASGRTILEENFE